MMRNAVLAVALLAGCSAGGSGDPAVSRAEQAAQLENEILSANVTDPTTLPTSGRATYAGFMTARLPILPGGARKDYVGDLDMQVNFAAPRNQVTGSATGFAAGQDTLTGALQITGGDLFRKTDTAANFTFTGNVDGTLTRGAARYAIDAEIEGEFRGRNNTGVNGLLFGDITGPAGQDIFDGSFAAERR